MKRRDVREHWSSQAFMAMFGVILAGFTGVLIGAGGYLLNGQPHPFEGLILALALGCLATEIALGARVVYCVYRFSRVGR